MVVIDITHTSNTFNSIPCTTITVMTVCSIQICLWILLL